MLKLIISLSFILLMGLPTPSTAGTLYFECKHGRDWKIEQPRSTWFGKVNKGRVFDRKRK